MQVLMNRQTCTDTPYGDAHQFGGLTTGQRTLPVMDLAALFTQVNDFEQVRVQTGHPYRALEQGVMRAVAAPGDHYPVQVMGFDVRLNVRQCFGETGE